MFGLFKKKSKAEVLQKKYEKLLKQSHELSTSSRVANDRKLAEAEEVLKEMESLGKSK